LTFLPVDRTMTVAELCKSIFMGDFTDIKEVGGNNNPFVNFDLKYEVFLFFVFISNPTWEGFLYFVFIFSGLKT
jgi:hypothetical protein